MKHLPRFLVIGLICSAIHGLAAAPQPAETNFFPIMAWDWPPNDAVVLQKMRDAGLTVAGFVKPGALDTCLAAGLKAIVSDDRASGYDWAHLDEAKARQNMASLAAEVGKHPALYGYYLCDEPSAGAFPGLGRISALIDELSPGKLPYIVLFPDYATPAQLGASNYSEHLEQFVATCRPPLIAYDNYSLMDDGSVREHYWTNLEAVRATTLRHGLEFWNTILAAAHFNYRELNAADYRFQVYTTLAYGGRGITYFKYFTPALGNYRLGPVDQFGNPTHTWAFMQNVNLQLQKLAPTFLQLVSEEVYHLGSVPNGCHGPSTNSLVVSISGGNFVVGDFTHRDGSRYVLVVNKSLSTSSVCAPEFRQPPRRVRHVSPYTGQLQPFEGEDKWLAPGHGALLKLER